MYTNSIDIPFICISRRKTYMEMINARPWGKGEKDDWERCWVNGPLFLMLKGTSWVVIILFYVSEIFHDRKNYC